MSAEQPWTEGERKVVRDSMQEVYDQFLDKTLAGRKKAGASMTKDKLLTLAGGRVWTGRQAKAAGLIDELGTLDDAVAAAKTMAGVSGKEMEILNLPRHRSFFERLAEKDGSDAALSGAVELLTDLPEMPKHLRHLGSLLRLQKERVWLIQPFATEIK